VAASLCAFWLPLDLDERLGLAVQSVFRLEGGRFDKYKWNKSRALKGSQKANQFEHVCNVQRGKLSSLSVTRERLLVGTGLLSSTHQLCRLQLP
jgi:hypothetical protein